ncbi:MAG: tetratricopeptide repeat protein, partial [Bacteroidota bacterium]
LLLQEIRASGNEAEYIPRVQYLLDVALQRDPENFEALIHKASLMLTLHQFEEGKRLAEQAIAQNPYSAFAHGVLVDALVELGEYDAAVKASDRMLSLRPDLRSYARASYLRELHGDTEGAIEAMKLAADAGVPGQENRAWVLYNLGNLYLQQGMFDVAIYIYRGIWEERPNYPYALSGLAQVQVAKKDFAGAISFLNEAYRILPSHHFLEQLIDVYLANGDRTSAEPLIREVLEAYEQDKDFGANPDLEFASFCVNNDIRLKDALQSIEREYARRPNNIQVLETFAWILAKQGRAAEAIPFIEKAMRLKTQRAELLYRAGFIYHAAGKIEQARTYLQQSLRSNISLNPVKQ